MIFGWILYSVCVTALLGLAARALEGARRGLARPARGIWLGSIVASVVLPAASYAAFAVDGPSGSESSGAAVPGSTLYEMSLRVETATRSSLWESTDAVLPIAWPVGSGLILVAVAVGAVVLVRARKRWDRIEVSGRTVLVSDGVGPAVVGLFPSEIVVPRDVAEADRETLEWIVAHEWEHVSARDPVFLAAGVTALVLVPWNLALWWQVARLRLAIEIDCDARVLAGCGRSARRGYGSALIRMGARPARRFRPLPAFTERHSSLERRIRSMSAPDLDHPVRRAATLVALGSLFIAAACLAPAPDRLVGPEDRDGTDDVQPVPVQVGQTQAEVEDKPTFTPYDVPPKLTNPVESRRALQTEYPPLLRDAGIGGVVKVYLFVDETGTVTDVRVDETSGHTALDAAALEVAKGMTFQSAQNRGEPVPVWISQEITFSVRPEGAREEQEPRPSSGAGASSAETPVDEAGPTFTPYDVPPKLTNPAEVQRTLQEEYPPLLRDAGIGGVVKVHLFIDETGTVTDVRVDETSGHTALDAAALEVAKGMTFQSAQNRGEPVPVWISQEITFSAK